MRSHSYGIVHCVPFIKLIYLLFILSIIIDRRNTHKIIDISLYSNNICNMYIKHYVDKNSINSSSSYILNKQCSSPLEIQSSRIVHPTINTS